VRVCAPTASRSALNRFDRAGCIPSGPFSDSQLRQQLGSWGDISTGPEVMPVTSPSTSESGYSPQVLADQMLDILVGALHLRPHRSFPLNMNGHGERVGRVTVYDGDHGTRIVDARLVVESSGIDSMMLHAFSDPATDLPHLTSDVAGVGSRWAFHVDLMPRVDLPGDLSTLEGLYEPLTPIYERAHSIPGSTPIPLPPRVRALSSAWIVGVSFDFTNAGGGRDAVQVMTDTFEAYVRTWLRCVDEGLPGLGTPESYLRPHGEAARARDARQRFALFHPDSDPVWGLLDNLVGPTDAAAILELIRGLV